MVPNVCGLVKWQLEIKKKSKLRQILQFCPPLSDFTHLVVPRTCFSTSDFLFCLECFPNLTTGLSDEGRGQVEPSTHKHCLRRREKLVEGGRWGAEG